MGIYLRDSKSCYIKNNKIGVDVVGGARIENGYHGILVMDSKFIEITGKNIISGNTKIGMHISKCVNIVVQGNHVGTDASGIVKIGNKGKGISIKDCIGVTVGGDRSLNEGNIISGNGKTLSHYGLEICGPLFYSKGVRICGNMIGTDISGKNVISNAGEGIYLNNVMDVVIGGPTDVNTSGKSIIGKTGNLISGNQSDGLAIIYSKVVFVLGNYIGTNLAGDAALISNKYSRGIRIVDSPFVWLGNFSKKNEWNLIAGNDCTGIVLADTQHDVISNNYIGVNPNALNKNIGIGNQGEGIHIDDWGNTKPGGSRNNYIVENRIAYNDGPGVSIWGNNSRYNLIWRNRFWANKNGLSIDLNNDGVTQNRPKGTAGPNDYLNFPVIESVTAVYDETTNTYLGTIIRGLVSNNCVVDLYKVDDTVPSKQGYGEGKEPLGFAKTTVSTPSIDEWEFMVTGLTENDTVSAIAIDPLLNTSEFCQNTKVKLQKVKSP